MNYRHCNNSHTFPVAVTCRQSYTDDLMLLVELKKRGARAKRQIIKALALGEELLALLYEGRDKLDGLRLRADELAKTVRLVGDGGEEWEEERSRPECGAVDQDAILSRTDERELA